MIVAIACAESSLPAICVVMVVLKLASSPKAAANSLRVSSAPGAASTIAFTFESIIDSICVAVL